MLRFTKENYCSPLNDKMEILWIIDFIYIYIYIYIYIRNNCEFCMKSLLV